MEAYNLFPSFEEENNKKKKEFRRTRVIDRSSIEGNKLLWMLLFSFFPFSSQISEGIQQQRWRELPRDCGGARCPTVWVYDR